MEPPRQAELLALVEAEQRHMRGLLARLKPAHMTVSGVTGPWSVKNVLAHITFWHRRLLHIVAAERGGCRADRIMRPGEEWSAALARINEQVYALSETQPLDLVLDDFRRTSQAVYRLVAGLRDEELVPPRPLLTTGDSLASLILDLAYEHPHAHRLEVQEWLLKLESRS